MTIHQDFELTAQRSPRPKVINGCARLTPEERGEGCKTCLRFPPNSIVPCRMHKVVDGRYYSYGVKTNDSDVSNSNTTIAGRN